MKHIYNKVRKLRNWMAGVACFCLVSCSSRPEVPANFSKIDKVPTIFPEYTEVTVPSNIAPLNFKLMEGADECVARFTAADGSAYVYGEDYKVLIDEEEWKSMLAASKGKAIKVEVFGNKNGKWEAYKPFNIFVAEEEIDPYCSYRVIMPSYVAYEMLSINERNLTNFEEREIYNNMIISPEDGGQCINCHSYQNYKTDNMQFHMRQGHGGTMIVRNGEAYKINMKSDTVMKAGVIGAGVYPSWHPTLPLIAYSVNETGQSFHTKDPAKIEVQDAQSDLILYDVEKNEVSVIENVYEEFECFPWWAPDGKSLYYSSAHFVYPEKNDSLQKKFANDEKGFKNSQIIDRYEEFKYDIYRKSFDEKTRTFGPPELVYAASKADSIGFSATFPRISPDGRYLLFGQGRFGCFHVWHPDADLYLTDLQTMETRKLENVNSDCAESYHSWSSNSRWIIFISRRDDNNYSRLYMAYFDKDGKAHKAFELPQEDPDFYDYYLRSYNVPEFMKEPVRISGQEFAAAAKRDPIDVKFGGYSTPSAAQRKVDGQTSASANKDAAKTDGNTGATAKKTDGETGATKKK